MAIKLKQMKHVVYTGLFLAILVNGCQSPKANDSAILNERNKEAREDSAKLALAYELQSDISHFVHPAVQTEPVQEDPYEDAADDPAIWYNHADPDKSLVFGTNKKSGIHSYALSGKQIGFYPLGKINNIDIRQNLNIGGQKLDVIGGSNRTDNSIILYGLDSAGNLYNLLPGNHIIDTTDIDEVYGFCLYRDSTQTVHALVNGKNGRINQYRLVRNEDGSYHLNPVKTWKLESQPEGMVADDDRGVLYIGEEEKGIWKLSFLHPEKEVKLIPDSQKENNSNIEYDIEGLSLYYGDKGDGFLIASIQGSFSYALFDRMENNYLGSFTIQNHHGIDGVEETDGLDIYSFPMGKDFPKGLLVAQDGFNYQDTLMVGQNFKFVDLGEVIKLVGNF